MTEEITRKPEYTVEYILSQIEEIRRDTGYISSAIRQFEYTQAEDGSLGGIKAKSESIANVVRCRETTNQMILEMYKELLDRLLGTDETADEDE